MLKQKVMEKVFHCKMPQITIEKYYMKTEKPQVEIKV